MPVFSKIAQLVLAALLLSCLTFAASFAEVPRSEFAPVVSRAE